MNGYNLLTEFFSDDKQRKSQVFLSEQGGLYKVVFTSEPKDEKNPKLSIFKFFTTQQMAENDAEDWVLKNG